MIALGLVALIVAALAIIATRTTITVVIRKDPDMTSIKQRLATIEAEQLDLGTKLGRVQASLDALSHPDTGAATATDVATLRAQVDAIKADIGTEDDAAPDNPGAAPLELTDPIPTAQ